MAQHFGRLSHRYEQWAAHHQLDPHQVGQQTMRRESRQRFSLVPVKTDCPRLYRTRIPITGYLPPHPQPCGTREIGRGVRSVTEGGVIGTAIRSDRTAEPVPTG
jgi:hypothetical protein